MPRYIGSEKSSSVFALAIQIRTRICASLTFIDKVLDSSKDKHLPLLVPIARRIALLFCIPTTKLDLFF